MKIFSAFVLVLLLASQAQAQVMMCVLSAQGLRGRLALKDVEIGILCNGNASSKKPVDCYKEARRIQRPSLGSYNAAILCSAAGAEDTSRRSFSPVECYRRAVRGMKSLTAVTACSKAVDYSVLGCVREVKDMDQLDLDEMGAAALCTTGYIAKEKSKSQNVPSSFSN